MIDEFENEEIQGHLVENEESKILDAECMFVSKLNNNLIKFVAESGFSEHLTNEVEHLLEVEKVEKVTKIRGEYKLASRLRN